MADFSILGDHICRRHPRWDNNQRNQSHHVSPYINDRCCRYMGVLKWNNLLIKIQHTIKRPTNKRYHKNQSSWYYQSFNWCWRCLSILFFRQKLDHQRYFMRVYHDRFYQNNEVYKFKDKFIFISNWVGSTNDICRVYTFCQRHIL